MSGESVCICGKRSLIAQIIVEGFLEKRSPNIRKVWQKRWFVLRGDTLSYYRDGTLAGEFPLHYHTKINFIKQKASKVFFEIGTADRIFELRTEDSDMARQWINACLSVIQQKNGESKMMHFLIRLASAINLSDTKQTQPLTEQAQVITLPDSSRTVSKKTGLKSAAMLGLDESDETMDDEYKYRARIRYLIERDKVTVNQDFQKEKQNDGFTRILSLDGGGLKGIMHSVLIERIMKRFPNFLQNVDVFTGCSGGALVSLGLAKGYSPTFCRHIFELAGNKIFTKKTLKNVNTAKYTNKWLQIACDEVWGNDTLGEMSRKAVIPAFQLDNQSNSEGKERSWEPRLFHNLKEGKTNGFYDRTSDVVMRSISAPTYFPSYQGYIDGGIFAHNPSYCTLSLLMGPEFQLKAEKALILSLGTGIVRRYLDRASDHDWGLMQWAPKITDLLFDSMVSTTNQACTNTLGKGYHRLDPILSRDIPMDDPTLTSRIATLANEVNLDNTIQWIEENFIQKSV